MTKRVRAIIVKDKKLLTIKRNKEGATFWVLPGGGVEDYDKDEIAALKRECLEEVNLDVEIARQVCSREFNGQIEDFYLCKIISGKVRHGNGPEYKTANYAGHRLPVWLDLDKLDKYDLKPSKIKNNIIKNKDIYKR